MIDSDNESHDDNHKPVKGSTSAETISKLHQDMAYLLYHDIPLVYKVCAAWCLSRVKRYYFKAKVLGAVLTNLWPALIFFTKMETIESRSNGTWKSLSAMWIISEICKGRPAIVSTCSTISTLDMRFLGFGFIPFWMRLIVLILNSAICFSYSKKLSNSSMVLSSLLCL